MKKNNIKTIVIIGVVVLFVILVGILLFVFKQNENNSSKDKYVPLDSNSYELTFRTEDNVIVINVLNKTDGIIEADRIEIKDDKKIIFEKNEEILLFNSTDNTLSYEIDNLSDYDNITVNLYIIDKNTDENPSIDYPYIEENDDSLTCSLSNIGEDFTENNKVIVKINNDFEITDIAYKKEVKYLNEISYEAVKESELGQDNGYSVTFDNNSQTITYYYSNLQYTKYVGTQYTTFIRDMSEYSCEPVEIALSYLCSKDEDATNATYSTIDTVLLTRDSDYYVSNARHSIKYTFNNRADYINAKNTDNYVHFTVVYDDDKLSETISENYELLDENGNAAKIDMLTYMSNLKTQGYSCKTAN